MVRLAPLVPEDMGDRLLAAVRLADGSHYTLMPRCILYPVSCICGFVFGLSGEERAHWKLQIGISMIAGTLHRATALDSICPENEIFTAIVAGLLHSHPCGVVKILKYFYVHGHHPDSAKAWQSSS